MSHKQLKMVFSDITLRHFAAVVSVVIVVASWFICYPRLLRSWTRHYSLVSDRPLIFPVITMVLSFCLFVFLFIRLGILDSVSGLLLFGPLILILPFQWRYAEVRVDRCELHGQTGMMRRLRCLSVYTIMFFVFMTPAVFLGIYKGLECVMPQISVVSDADGGYSTNTFYGWLPGHGAALCGDYIDNCTDDSLFRVTVRYAIPGVDLRNNYAVTDSIPPSIYMRMYGPVDYYMQDITPLRMWNTDKNGHRFQRIAVYLVNSRQLESFVDRDLTPIGLQPSARVRTIDERSRPKWNDTVKDKVVEQMLERFMR